jgi:sec-independent protein translocase protein TatB
VFDVGWDEILLVVIVALVVVGPKDLPKLMHTVGRWAGQARRMAEQFRANFDEMARAAELEELRAEIKALRDARPMEELEANLNEALAEPQEKKPVEEKGGHTPSEP